MRRVAEACPWDSAADQMAAQFLRTRLPPPGSKDEEEGKDRKVQVQQAGSVGGEKKRRRGRDGGGVGIHLRQRVRVAIEGGARLVVEDECAVVYHMMDNERRGHNAGPSLLAATPNGVESNGEREEDGGEGEDGEENGEAGGCRVSGRLVFDLDDAEMIEQLLGATQRAVKVADVASEFDAERTLAIVACLVEHGVLECC